MNLLIFLVLACSNILFQHFGANVADYNIAVDRSLFQGVALGIVALSNWVCKE
jgi:hypothetical protein